MMMVMVMVFVMLLLVMVVMFVMTIIVIMVVLVMMMMLQIVQETCTCIAPHVRLYVMGCSDHRHDVYNGVDSDDDEIQDACMVHTSCQHMSQGPCVSRTSQ